MATKANIGIDQGTTFSTEILLTDDSGNPLDLSAFTAQAQMRPWYTSTNTIPFSVNIGTGSVTLSLNAATTSTLDRPRYVFDVTVTDSSNNITRVVEGVVYVDPTVTRVNPSNTYYTMLVSDIQGTFFTGDTVYQSNGSANIAGQIYYCEKYFVSYNQNTCIIKVTSNNSFVVSSNTDHTTYLYDANSSANGIVMTVNSAPTR